jgi:hypothetical protein
VLEHIQRIRSQLDLKGQTKKITIVSSTAESMRRSVERPRNEASNLFSYPNQVQMPMLTHSDANQCMVVASRDELRSKKPAIEICEIKQVKKPKILKLN